MSDFISREEHHAEVAALQNHIYTLTKFINDTEKKRLSDSIPDPKDPFDNPTEYHDYQDDYTEVLPPAAFPEYTIKHNPSFDEHRKLKSFYSIGGWCTLLQFLFSTAAFIVGIPLVRQLIERLNPTADSASIAVYIRGSSILMAMNMFVFIIANVGCGLIGLKLSKTKLATLFKTKEFDISSAIQYCFIAVFILFASRVTAIALGEVILRLGFDVSVDSSGLGVTHLGVIVSLFYSCIIAPVTEEFFYRGMLLKVFSKSNQRFAVFITAFFFGIGHGNLHQFVLGFFMGIFLAHITLKHGSIIPSIFVHVFINSVVNLIASLNISRAAEYIVSFGIEIVAIIGAFILLIFRIRDKVPKTTPAQTQRGFVIARGSIGFILAASLPVIYAVYNVYMNNR